MYCVHGNQINNIILNSTEKVAATRQMPLFEKSIEKKCVQECFDIWAIMICWKCQMALPMYEEKMFVSSENGDLY